MNPTDKQTAFVKRIMDKMGVDVIKKYFPDYDFDCLTKVQAQKVITTFGHRTAKPIYGVAGRDVYWLPKWSSY